MKSKECHRAGCHSPRKEHSKDTLKACSKWFNKTGKSCLKETEEDVAKKESVQATKSQRNETAELRESPGLIKKAFRGSFDLGVEHHG